MAFVSGEKGRFYPQYILADCSPVLQLHYTMSSSDESATAISGSELLSESEHSSDIERSDSDANGQPPLVRPARAKKAPAKKKISSISWACDDDHFPCRHGFQGTPGIHVHELDENSSPLKIFE